MRYISIRFRYSLLILCLFLGFGLRMHGLDRFGFWQDEGLTLLRANYGVTEILSNHVTIQGEVTNDTVPAFYFLTLHFSRQLWGESDFAYRYLSLIAGILLIPILYQLGQHLNGKAVGLMTAFLVAINPLQIWYAQEARMYTLAILLMAVAAYFLWRAVKESEQLAVSSKQLRKWFVLYLVFAGLGFYTHYLAAFLIMGQGLLWLWLFWQQGLKKWIIAGIASAILLAIPIIPFTIPRLLTGAESNYFRIPAWQILLDVLHGFGWGPTGESNWVLDLGLLGVLLVGLMVTLFSPPHSSNPQLPTPSPPLLRPLFLIITLLAIPAGIIAISPLKPMYQNVRHIMIGSPAFYLLVALGVVGIWRLGDWKIGRLGTEEQESRGAESNPNSANLSFPHRRESIFMGKMDTCLRRYDTPIASSVFRFLAVGAFLLPLAGSLISLHNLYRNPRYAKDDTRALIQYVAQHAGINDAILYNDAITLPIHQHYSKRQDIQTFGLPNYPYLFSPKTITKLETIAAQYDRLWLIWGPPADKRDDDRQVQQWLNDNLVSVDSFSAPGQTHVIKVEAFSRKIPFAGGTSVAHWDGLPALTAIQPQFEQPATMPALWFTLTWDKNGQPNKNTQLLLTLQGEDRADWAKSSLDLWSGDGTIRPTAFVSLPAGFPAGEYQLILQPWDKATQSPLGEKIGVETISIAGNSQWSTRPDLLYPHRCPLTFENGVQLEYVATAGTVKPGHPLPATLFWQGNGDTKLQYKVEVIAADGSILRELSGTPYPGWMAKMPASERLQTQTGFYFPPETVPGRYHLRWTLFHENEIVKGRDCRHFRAHDSTNFGAIMVEPWPLVTEMPATATPIQANFGHAIKLAGYEIEQGESLTVKLLWLTVESFAQPMPAIDYKVFRHLRNNQGEIVQQCDGFTGNGLRPSRSWRPGEIITDDCQLPLTDLPAGEYSLFAGLYEPNTFIRPTVTVDGKSQADNEILITSFTIP